MNPYEFCTEHAREPNGYACVRCGKPQLWSLTWTRRMRVALYARNATLTIPGTLLFNASRFFRIDNYLSRRIARKVSP